jgi:hypothetical protein
MAAASPTTSPAPGTATAFHGNGAIEEGSGSGRFEGVSGRVAQLNTAGKDAGDGTFGLSYDLVFETAAD